MFKHPGTYDCIMRYSSLLPKLAPDNLALPRGIGIKIFGIKGEKIWGEDKETQDWTMNNYPVLELRDAKTTYEIADSLERNFDDIPSFADEMGKRPDAELATVPVKLPRQHSEYRSTTFLGNFRLLFDASVCHAGILSVSLPPWPLRCEVRRLSTRRSAKEEGGD